MADRYRGTQDGRCRLVNSISASFLIPQGEPGPLRIEFRHEALEMVVVDRDQWNAQTAKGWQSTGGYLLFGPPEDDGRGRYSVYVGKAAPGTVASRLNDHSRNREGWDRALLFRRTTDSGFNSTDMGWLEGRLFSVLSSSGYADLGNRATPGDDTISDWDRGALERVVTLILSVMRVLGFRSDEFDTEKADEAIGDGRDTVSSFDADRFHRVVGLVKRGEWTSYGDVAAVIGSHPRGLGAHIRHCDEPAPEWRILNKRGESQPGFTWASRDRIGSQLDALIEEGVPLIGDNRADPRARVDAAVLRQRLSELEHHEGEPSPD